MDKNNEKSGATPEKSRTVRSKLQLLVSLSVISLALILTITAAILVSTAMKKNFRDQAICATSVLKESIENGNPSWEYDAENGILTCNGNEITVDLFNSINNTNNQEFHTVFWNDTRVITNIKNANGQYATGTTADSAIFASVKSGNTFSKNSVKIFDKNYTVCYMPIYNDGEFCGMLFTGINEKSVTTNILSITLCLIVFAIIILILTRIISGRSLNEISNNLSSRLNNGYDMLSNYSTEVKSISDRTNKEVSEITLAMDNVANGATGQAAATEEAMASTEEFTASIDVVNSEINESFDFIATIRDCVSESENSIVELNESIDANNRIVDDISIDIENGVESTRKAKSIVKTIDNLAFQINLLALNASVEASHAGSFGKGFAVVAEEIKNLAASSAESASNTADIIADIVGTMTKTQDSNQKLIKSNDNQLIKAKLVSEKMSILKDTINDLVGKLDHIKEQSNSLGEVKNELVTVIQSLSSASEDNAAISEEVSASTTTVESDIDNLISSLENLSDISNNLKEIIEYFG